MIEIIPGWHPIFVHFTITLFIPSVGLYGLANITSPLKLNTILSKHLNKLRVLSILIVTLLSSAHATKHTVDLYVNYKDVDFTGECRTAITINNQIPAPILHFKEGDQVTINVHNHL